MNSQPMVSIVTPVRNGSRYIGELIDSVLEQDYLRIEHIIIDDGSDDDGATVATLKRYPHVRWWSRENRGAYATINEGLAASTGELVTIICSDDKYASKTAISDVVNCFLGSNRYDVVYGETITIDEHSKIVEIEGPRSGPLWMFQYYPVVSHCSMLVKRERLIAEGIWFDETFPYAADFDWIMRMIRVGFKFHRIRRSVAMFRQHPAQRSGDVTQARVEEWLRIKALYGEGNPCLRIGIQRWVTLVRLKNSLLRCGMAATICEVRERFGSWPSNSILK